MSLEKVEHRVDNIIPFQKKLSPYEIRKEKRAKKIAELMKITFKQAMDLINKI